ncbi:MAG: hypothetical protein OSB67_06710 [Alphaproteobacteria bacterium]|nr:hypothetical protein [Alphaproteobacteria bacterium]
MRCAPISGLIVVMAIAITLDAGIQPVVAQQGGPIRLAPLPATTQRTPDVSVPETREERPQPSRVMVEGIGSLTEDALGLLGDGSGGLGRDMWSGSRRVDVLRLLRDLPESYPTRAAYSLATRVLLTAATPPVASRKGEGMLGLRVEKLVAIGATESALRLVSAVSAREVPKNLTDHVVRAHFRNGNFMSGCAVARGFDGDYTDIFWQQALIVCQVSEGNTQQAAFGLDLLREQGLTVSPAFAAAALDISQDGAIRIGLPETVASPDSMTFALWLAGKAEMSDWLVEALDPGLLPALFGDPNVDPDLRLMSAHRALRHGVLDAADVVRIYRELKVPDGDINKALIAFEDVSKDRLLAYLYLAAEAHTGGISRSEALLEAWNRSRESGGFDVVALTTSALLDDVPVTPDFAWLAGDATKAALAAGDKDRALAWYRLVLRQASIVPELANAAVLLWPQMRAIGHVKRGAFALIAGTGVTAAVTGQQVTALAPRGPVPWNAKRFERWIDLARNDPSSADVGAVLTLITALGDPVDDAQWGLVPFRQAQPAMMPDASVLAGLTRASESGRKAETALYALYVLGQSGEAPHASLLGAVAEALNKVGINDVAHALVREAIVVEAP